MQREMEREAWNSQWMMNNTIWQTTQIGQKYGGGNGMRTGIREKVEKKI